MKKLLKITLSALLLAGTVSCGSKSEPNYKKDFDVVAIQKNGLITIDLGKIKGKTAVGLSEFVEPLEIIQLEGGSQDMMFERGRMSISENYILTGRTLKLFDRKTGKFIAQVGNQGRGPGEYALLYDVQISEKDNRIFVLPWQTERILTYDLKGDFKGEIPLPYFVPKGKINLDLSKNEITVMTFPLKDERVNIRPIWVQDTLGNVKHSIDSDPHFADIPYDFSNELNSGKSGDELIYALINASNLPDTLYHYDPATNELIPKANIYIKDLKPTNGDYSKVIWNTIYELPEFYICNVAGTVCTAEGWYEGEQGVDFMVYKDDLKGGGCAIVNDYLADEKVSTHMFLSGGDEFWNILDSDYFERAINEAKDEEVKKRLQEAAKNIDPEGNDILIIGKYKK